MNKKGILIVLLFILTMPVMINASVSYESGVDKSKNYIKRISGYDRFILTNIESGFEYGGLLSKEEFNITKVNGKSYLAIGPQYWLKQASNNKKYVVDFRLREVTNELFSGVRVTEHIKPNVKVIGKGTQSQPWEFIGESYIVKYNANGGTGNMQQATYEIDKSVSLPLNTFTRSGYIFDGWNTKSDGSGTNYANGASVKNLTTTSGATVTLYAKWKSNNISTSVLCNSSSNNANYSIVFSGSCSVSDSIIHFLSSGTLWVNTAATVEAFCVGGGGGGGCVTSTAQSGGGGGGGGYTTYSSSISLAKKSYSVTIGAGGAANSDGGASSIESLISAAGGGRGWCGGSGNTPNKGGAGGNGGSGGGGGGYNGSSGGGPYGGTGGSGGANGGAGGGTAGAGQGSAYHAGLDGIKYGGGGGGGAGNVYDSQSSGGTIGGGHGGGFYKVNGCAGNDCRDCKASDSGANGTANFGGGGGGAALKVISGTKSCGQGTGGSGRCMIRQK